MDTNKKEFTPEGMLGRSDGQIRQQGLFLFAFICVIRGLLRFSS